METKNSVLTTVDTDYNRLNTIISAFELLNTSSNDKIRACMGLSLHRQPKYLLNLLLAVKSLNGATKGGLVRRFDYSTRCSSNGIDTLFGLGLIGRVKRPRLIIPFGAYKNDVGYVITEKGERVLRDILLG